MVDAHRDARGRPAFALRRQTICALLDGAKRIGDLRRVRALLAELVKRALCGREDEFGGQEEDLVVDEEVMTHVFHAYAAYKPPPKHTSRVLSAQTTTTEDTAETDVTTTAQDTTSTAFSRVPPQTRAQVLAEAEALLSRIQADTQHAPSSAAEAPPVFEHVALTPRLLNSFLSVLYAHAPLETARARFQSIFLTGEHAGTALSFVEALERCAARGASHERAAALAWAEELWPAWAALERAPDGTVDARLVERAHVAMVRVLTLFVPFLLLCS
jgi:hypothetical protein